VLETSFREEISAGSVERFATQRRFKRSAQEFALGHAVGLAALANRCRILGEILMVSECLMWRTRHANPGNYEYRYSS
jgi:hypothetical protein